MNKQEIIDGLEGLKDLVNDNGKHQLDTFKAAVAKLKDTEKPEHDELKERDHKRH